MVLVVPVLVMAWLIVTVSSVSLWSCWVTTVMALPRFQLDEFRVKEPGLSTMVASLEVAVILTVPPGSEVSRTA